MGGCDLQEESNATHHSGPIEVISRKSQGGDLGDGTVRRNCMPSGSDGCSPLIAGRLLGWIPRSSGKEQRWVFRLFRCVVLPGDLG